MTGIESSSGNVHADLGLPEAADMLVKAQLAMKIGRSGRSGRSSSGGI